MVATVPTDSERSGDLSGFLGSFICADGSTSASACGAGNQFLVTTTEGALVPAQAGMVFDPSTGNADGSGRQVFCTGGKVNVLTPSPIMKTLLGFLPEPKPVGMDLISAKKLNDDVNAVLSEDQVFRIDHYLGKETVQNILFFRFGNGIFEPMESELH